MTFIKKTLPFFLVLFLAACQTTPPPDNKPPVDNKPPTDVKDPGVKTPPVDNKPTPLADTEYDEAQKSITQAEEADAARYSPNLLAKAKAGFAQAKALQATDPVQAKALLDQAKLDAKAAYDEAITGQKTAYLSRIEKSKSMVKGIEGDKFSPEAYTKADALGVEAAALFDAKDMTNARLKADEAVKSYTEIYDPLLAQQSRVKTLKAETAAALQEADTVEAYIWAPDDVEKANQSYFTAADKYRKFDINASEEAYGLAKLEAKAAVAKAKTEKSRKESEDLMLETMKKLEDASKLTVVDENDNIIRPQPWNGKKELTTPKTEETPKSDGNPQSIIIPKEGSPAVMGDTDSLTYLDKAKELWRKGVAEKNAGNYALANDLFLESQRLIKAYQALAVDKLYTVRLIPERRDALWRIAEYSQIYGDPLQWPKIWKRNKKLIQNPDLIYPGWELVIPPK